MTTDRHRTWLFVPGDRPDRFAKAVASGTDRVVLDLEDAVDHGAKSSARESVVRWLADGGAGWVRVNSGDDAAADADALLGVPGLRGIVVPKAEDPEEVAALAAGAGGTRVLALVETAAGLERARQLAAHECVAQLAFGSVDFAADIAADHTDEALAHARGALVVASRSAGVLPPVDGVTTSLADPERAGRDAARARSLGFGGKLCIHPSQVEPVHRAFDPSTEQRQWAQRVVDLVGRSGAGAHRLDGELVDEAVYKRALAITEAST